jgi:hypothetical protein
MLDKLDDYARRPMHYQNIDGIWEMGIGFLFVMMTLSETSLSGAPRNTVWHWRGTFVVILALLFFVVWFGVKALKERITYRRTGFVKYRGLAGKPWLTALIAGAIGAPIAILFNLLLRHSRYSVKAALISVTWGLLYAFATKLDEPWRWVVLAVMVSGPVVISELPLDPLWLDTLPVGFLGLIFFVSGGIALCLYLRRSLPPKQEAE